MKQKHVLQEEQTTEAPASAPAAAPAPAKAADKPAKAKKAKPAAKKAAPKKKPSGKSGKNKGIEGPGVLKTYAPDYRKGGKDGKAKTAGGNKAIDCGDKIADMLSGKTLEEVYEKAVPVLNKALEEGDKEWTVKSLKAKYGHLNPGMQRMNLGNRMRAILFPKPAKK